MITQGSHEWHLQRIGYFTSSEIGKLLTKGKSKDEVFGDTAKTYIRSIAAERDMNPKFLDIESGAFDLYLSRTSWKTQAMRWGSNMEPMARSLYEKTTGFEVEEVGFVQCNNFYGDSSDGLCKKDGEVVGVLEIKCPEPSTHKLYRQMESGSDLKAINLGYYCQCQMHMVAHGVEWCDFASYDPMCMNPIHIVRVNRDEAFISELTSRIELANQYIDTLR